MLAAILTGVLVFLKNQPPQVRAIAPIVEIQPMEPDSSKWGHQLPQPVGTLQKTETNNIDTTYGGSSKFSQLERDPRQMILFAGYPFSKEYNDDRGHMNAVEDVRETERLNLKPGDPKETPATCYSCKSSNNPGLWEEMGMEAYDAMMFSEMTPKHPEFHRLRQLPRSRDDAADRHQPGSRRRAQGAGQGLDDLHPPGNAHRGMRQLPRGILLCRRQQVPDLPLGERHAHRPDHLLL